MTAGPTIYTPNPVRILAERAAEDWGVFMFDGLGIMPSDDQVEARHALGRPGPRDHRSDPKMLYVSGGQRAGKTVELFAWHAEACLYKIGVDNTDHLFWNNYLYKTLGGAPTAELSLRLWQVADEISKGASDAQWDRNTRHSRGGHFLHLFEAGKSGDWPIVRFYNGAVTNFRSFEGYAYRVEGDQWWLITYDEWASQPDREIETIRTEVLMGRARDHDAKIVFAAWPKKETEHHLIEVIRKIEKGADRDSRVVYLSAEDAFFTNRNALKAERARKTDAQWQRTVLGRPAGGASVEFPQDVVEHMVNDELRYPAIPEPGQTYLTSWDLGLAHDSTVGITWLVPPGDVTPENKVRIVNAEEIKGGESTTLDTITWAIAKEQLAYRSQSAVDASGLGGVAAVRQLQDLTPPPLRFVARSNDRLHGNMRIAAITNGLDLLTWGRPLDDEGQTSVAWGLVEMPRIVPLLDQLANFDREAKGQSDDWVWAFLIGLWYIRRFYVLSRGSGTIDFDVARGTIRKKRITYDMRGN